MDALLNPQTGGYVVNQSAQSIENELYIRLVTPLGSYWADRTLGSRLHELRRQKHLKRIEVLAKQYAEQALQPVIQVQTRPIHPSNRIRPAARLAEAAY